MEKRIKIEFPEFSTFAQLLESPVAEALRWKLPFSSQVNRWGEEIYFSVPVHEELAAGACEVVEKGDVAYWPPGKAMAIFFGPTPVSLGDECRAASPVNVFARISGDLSALSGVVPGTEVRVSFVQEGENA